jgi:hypothetical protein
MTGSNLKKKKKLWNHNFDLTPDKLVMAGSVRVTGKRGCHVFLYFI